jgi:predicted ATPase
MAPRMVWCCHPVAAAICSTVAPSGRLSIKALILLLQGYLDRALVCSRGALAAAYDLDHAFTTSQALYLTSWFHQVRRERRVAEERSRALIEFTTERGFPAWLVDGTILNGWAVAEGGDADRGIAQLRQGLAAKDAIGVQQHTPGFLGLLAELQLGLRNSREALDVLEMALARVDRLEERWFEAHLLRLKGEALLAMSPERPTEAEICYQQALAVARDQGACLWELRAATSLARLGRDQGRSTEAHDLLAPVYGWFTEGFETADLAGH